MFVPEKSILVGLCGAIYFHVIYAYRAYFTWARVQVEFWQRLTGRRSSAVVPGWALLLDVMVMIVALVPRLIAG